MSEEEEERAIIMQGTENANCQSTEPWATSIIVLLEAVCRYEYVIKPYVLEN
jgi:hypothetical protein